jgi:hypothetical protein
MSRARTGSVTPLDYWLDTELWPFFHKHRNIPDYASFNVIINRARSIQSEVHYDQDTLARIVQAVEGRKSPEYDPLMPLTPSRLRDDDEIAVILIRHWKLDYGLSIRDLEERAYVYQPLSLRSLTIDFAL